VERACQFDIELDAVKRETFTGRLRALEQERAEREIDNQAILWRSVQDIGAILEKANAAPITDITQLKQEVVGDKLVKNTNKVKGLSMAGYARLVAVRNETARQAIVGVREKPAAVEDARVVERVVLKTGRKG
jgi:hypothetical protein